ncbi:MAG: HDIG domain-containing metalloprotein [Phormidesmis sp.]
MSLRHFANRVYTLWSHSFLRLKHPRRYLKQKARERISQKKIDYQQKTDQVPSPRYAPWLEGIRHVLLLGDAAQISPKKNKSKRARRSSGAHAKQATGWDRFLPPATSRRTWLVATLAVLLLATCFGQRFYRQPGLDIRSISPRSFYAPTSAVIEDKKATESRRADVRNGSAQVLRIDLKQTAEAEQSLQTLLRQGRELREQAGRPNFLNLDTLSQPTQDYLFQADESQWSEIWYLAKTSALSAEQVAEIRNGSSSTAAGSADSEDNPGSEGNPNSGDSSDLESSLEIEIPVAQEIIEQVRSLTPPQLETLQELVEYRELSGFEGLVLLETRVDTRRQQYIEAKDEFIAAASSKDQPLYNYRLFDLSEEEWTALESGAEQIFKEMMLQGINPGAPEDLLRRAIEARVAVEPNPVVRQLMANVLAAVAAPNLVIDEARTRQQAEQAVRQIDPVTVTIEKDDLIVSAGEVITTAEFALLDHFELTERHFNWVGLGGFTLLIGATVAFYLWISHQQTNPLHQRDHALVLLLCLLVSTLAALQVPTIGLPAVGLLVGSFYGSVMGMTVVGLLALVLPIGTAINTIPMLAGCAAAVLGAGIAPQLRSREEFALLGGFVGLAQAGVHLVLTLMHFTVAAPLWKAVFVGSAMHGLYGIAWSVVALGLSPYLEHFFDVVTPIRLAELANPNRPLLKRLAAETPGTFQHTMFVANLAEAAARELGRNVELVRAGTLYHDIGKMHSPQGFIENQMGGPNLHDALADPWKSASIIKKHVTQGLVMARQYRLPLAVQAFIPEHQGDMKISYFYQQAKERQEKEPSLVVNPADFSYDGPIPQSPETGITMLADSCEAALRSLKPEASMDEAYSMVNKILRARWRSRQLIDSGLTREDMDVIAGVFIHVWQQHNHKRIAYPKQVLAVE